MFGALSLSTGPSLSCLEPQGVSSACKGGPRVVPTPAAAICSYSCAAANRFVEVLPSGRHDQAIADDDVKNLSVAIPAGQSYPTKNSETHPKDFLLYGRPLPWVWSSGCRTCFCKTPCSALLLSFSRRVALGRKLRRNTATFCGPGAQHVSEGAHGLLECLLLGFTHAGREYCHLPVFEMAINLHFMVDASCVLLVISLSLC